MQKIYSISDSIISALGNNSQECINSIIELNGGLEIQHRPEISNNSLPLGSINWQKINSNFKNNNLDNKYTNFEKICILTAIDAINKSGIDASKDDVVFVLSTTKGNIELLDIDKYKNFDTKNRIHLWSSAEVISKYFNNNNQAIIISNACVSGVMALITASETLRNSTYKHAVVIGGDVLSHFVVSGFQSFQSLSDIPCIPYDSARKGLTLGEAAGCVILSKEIKSDIQIMAGASHNDANHISGPSRTAEGMYAAAKDAIKYSEISNNDIDIISAHGTATLYNDEMEAIGISRLELQNTPIHSLKGFWGHTLGAAGIIETIALIWAMRNNKTLPTLGYTNHGVSKELNLSKQIENHKIKYAMKIASGFSGINSTIILKKEGASK